MALKDYQKWFKEARLGLFIHWGLYSVLGKGEWAMMRERYTNEEYAKLTQEFMPENFDMETWFDFAEKCGVKYMVFTTRHHDGFALWDSQADSYNSVKSPINRDFVAEFTTLCRKHNMKVGLYFSLGDWRYGFPKENDSFEKAEKMRELTYAQLRELMTNYGKIDLVWYDGGWCYPSLPTDTAVEVAKFWRADELNAMVRSLQPDILINNRSGTPEDFSTPEGVLGRHSDKLCEACFTLGENYNCYWGYNKSETIHKSIHELMYLVINSITAGNNILLNVGPDGQGIIPAWQQDLMLQLGEWVKGHKEAIFGIDWTDIANDKHYTNGNQFCTIGEGKEAYYAYFRHYPDDRTFIPAFNDKICKAEFIENGCELQFEHKDGGLLLKGFPEEAPDKLCSVVRLTKGVK